MSPTPFFRLASFAIFIGIWTLSFLPGTLLPTVPGTDKWHHALAYFIAMYCWGQWVPRPAARLKLALAFIAMGALIEYLQGLTTYRTFEWLDIVANTTGVVIGWLIVTIQFAVQRRFRPVTGTIFRQPD